MHGKAKGYGYVAGTDKYEGHAWNKITIEGKPFLCDTTWGSGGIGKIKQEIKSVRRGFTLRQGGGATSNGSGTCDFHLTGQITKITSKYPTK